MALRIVLLSLNSSSEEWVKKAASYYEAKLERFCDFEKVSLKPFNSGRSEAEEKKRKDSEILLKKISPDDFVILCDEKGEKLDSINFARKMEKLINFSRKRYVFVLGGPYGVSEQLHSRADFMLNLSSMTMNHWVVEVMLLEQIYRSFTILKKIPYHNI